MMKRAWLVAGALGILLSTSACHGVIVNAGDIPGGGGGGGDGSGTSDPGSGEAHPTAVAMRFSQWAAPTTDPGSLFSIGYDTDVEPDALVLFFASKAQACPQPFITLDDPSIDPSVCAEQAFWQTIIILPPDLVKPGVIDTSLPEVFMYRAEWMAACGGGHGEGPGFDGSITIKSMDASNIDLTLDVTPITSDVTTQNGDYTATFCL